MAFSAEDLSITAYSILELPISRPPDQLPIDWQAVWGSWYRRFLYWTGGISRLFNWCKFDMGHAERVRGKGDKTKKYWSHRQSRVNQLLLWSQPGELMQSFNLYSPFAQANWQSQNISSPSVHCPLTISNLLTIIFEQFVCAFWLISYEDTFSP